jgi:hypothetical protein
MASSTSERFSGPVYIDSSEAGCQENIASYQGLALAMPPPTANPFRLSPLGFSANCAAPLTPALLNPVKISEASGDVEIMPGMAKLAT